MTGIIALVTAVGTAISVWLTRRKTNAEAGNVVVDSAEKAVRLAVEQMERMEARLEQAEWHIEKLEQQIFTLKAEGRRDRTRVLQLEEFIRLNTDFDPEQINGHPI